MKSKHPWTAWRDTCSRNGTYCSQLEHWGQIPNLEGERLEGFAGNIPGFWMVKSFPGKKASCWQLGLGLALTGRPRYSVEHKQCHRMSTSENVDGSVLRWIKSKQKPSEIMSEHRWKIEHWPITKMAKYPFILDNMSACSFFTNYRFSFAPFLLPYWWDLLGNSIIAPNAEQSSSFLFIST